MRLLTWCGIVAPVVRLSLILSLGLLDPEYSQLRDAISELGARGAPHAAVMSYVGISLVGVLLVLFSVALYRAYRPGPLPTAGAGLLALAGLAFVAVGLFPCDPGCSRADPSLTMQIHLVAGLTGMTAQTLAVVTFGLHGLVRGSGGPQPMLGAALGAVASAALLVFFAQIAGVEIPHPGLSQKVSQAATDLWVLVAAVGLVGGGEDDG